MSLLKLNSVDYKFAGCQQTALSDDLLAEIGRITVHYGMFVAQVHDFLNVLKPKEIEEWGELSNEKAVSKLADILRLLRPKFPIEYQDWLTNGFQQVFLAQSIFKKAVESKWGVDRTEGNAVVNRPGFGGGSNS